MCSQNVSKMFEKCYECEKEAVHFCKEDDLLRAVEQFRDSLLEIKQNPEISSKYHKHVIMNWMYHCEEDFEKVIEGLDNNAACSPDGWTVKLIKILKKPISRFLTVIYNTSMSQGRFPRNLKYAYVTGIHKGGLKDYQQIIDQYL